MLGPISSKGWTWDSNPRALTLVSGHFLSSEASILNNYRERGGDMSVSRQKELVPIILIIKTLASVVNNTIS